MEGREYICLFDRVLLASMIDIVDIMNDNIMPLILEEERINSL